MARNELYPKHLSQTIRLHTCSICGDVAPWSDTWIWYGSLRDIDDSRPVINTCSDKCRAVREIAMAEARRASDDTGT